MGFSIARILGYFQGNLGLVRVKVAFEVGRSLLSRTEQGTAFQAEGTAQQKHSGAVKRYQHVCGRMEIWSVQSVRLWQKRKVTRVEASE